MKLGANSKGVFDGDKLSIAEKNVIRIHSSSVIKIDGIDDILITISSDNILKAFKCRVYIDENQIIEPIGGGSLKQRLGSDKLTCMRTDPITKKIFLGTEKGKIIVYLLENSPRFLYCISCEQNVKDLDVKWGSLFVACGGNLLAYPDSSESYVLAAFNPKIEGLLANTIKFVPEKDRVYVGYSVFFI